jgi:hypothetical protein
MTAKTIAFCGLLWALAAWAAPAAADCLNCAGGADVELDRKKPEPVKDQQLGQQDRQLSKTSQQMHGQAQQLAKGERQMKRDADETEEPPNIADELRLSPQTTAAPLPAPMPFNIISPSGTPTSDAIQKMITLSVMH